MLFAGAVDVGELAWLGDGNCIGGDDATCDGAPDGVERDNPPKSSRTLDVVFKVVGDSGDSSVPPPISRSSKFSTFDFDCA